MLTTKSKWRSFLISLGSIFLLMLFQNCQKSGSSGIGNTINAPCSDPQSCSSPADGASISLDQLATGYRVVNIGKDTSTNINFAPFLAQKTGIEVIVTTPPSHGTLQIGSDLKGLYTPENGFIGIDSFQYRLTSATSSTVVTSGFIRVGPIYYVDSVEGSDSQLGSSPSQAWQSLSKVNSTSLAPGSIVVLKRSSLWRDTLNLTSGTTGQPIIFSAYGTGDKPKILGSVDGKSQIWTETSAGSGLWKSHGLSSLVGTGTEFLSNTDFETNTTGWSLYTNASAGANATIDHDVTQFHSGAASIKVSINNSGATSNEIQLYSLGVPSITAGNCYLLKFSAMASTALTLNPSQFVKVMKSESPYTNYGTPLFYPSQFKFETTWKTFAMEWSAASSASDAGIDFFFGNISTSAVNIWIDDVSLKTASCTQPTLLENDIGNIIFDNEQSNGWKKWSPTDLVNENDFYYDPYDFSVTLLNSQNPSFKFSQIELAENRYILNGDNSHDVTIENLDLRYGAAHGLAFSYNSNIFIHNLDISWMGGGVQGPLTSNPVRYGNGIQFYQAGSNLVVDGCRISQIYDTGLTPQGEVSGHFDSVQFYNNFVEKSEYCYEFFNYGVSALSKNMKFTYNTCKDSGFGWGHIQRPQANGSDVMLWSNSGFTESMLIKNNIMVGVRDWSLRLDQPWNGLNNLIMDFNLRWPSSLGDPQVPAGSAGSIAVLVSPSGSPTPYPSTLEGVSSYQQASSFDQHSLFEDPQFKDAAKAILSSTSRPIDYSLDDADATCIPSETSIPLYCLGNLSIDGNSKRDKGKADLGRHFIPDP